MTYLKNSIVTTVVTMIVVAICQSVGRICIFKLKVAGEHLDVTNYCGVDDTIQTLMIPLYSIMANLHLRPNTRLSMILIYVPRFRPRLRYHDEKRI